uniref:Uncharacterized protein n=1 Tax=Anabas testudineus TaxID=64144 RepID=A0A3Q1HXZ2_ANATE
ASALQAQLALHRLKLAQGGSTATAATVLNQVLSNVAMSHPLFNQLQTSSIVGNPQAAFPTAVLGFPSSNSTLGTLVGGGFNQNPGNVRLNHPVAGGTVGLQDAEYSKKSASTYPCDTDRRLQYKVVGGSAAATANDEQYKVMNTQTKNGVGFQRDFYGQDMHGQQLGFSVSEQNMNVYNTTAHKDQWKGPVNLTRTGKVDMVSNAAPMWAASGQPIQTRMELYNPEEPTPDSKFNPSSGVSSFGLSGTQGFVGCQPPHGCEETISSGTRKLQPYQVNDYHAVTPTQLPHQCSICDKKVYNLKDWDQHVKGKLHLQNRTLYANERKGTVGRVVHICNLPEGSCTENDVINLGLPFGKVTNYILMRSTHQAFLEMAYVEAAQAMVQYYQLTPAMINNQKLLIRMSKRYKELQLKKPGKDVQSIIEDITSQRERDEMQELERYMPERARSRSPLSRSLSPHSHSPSFTSCSSAHSPQRAPCRGQERGNNGLAPCRNSWDWSPHLRRSEDERERDDPWRNGGSVDDDRPNGRVADRRKAYQKPLDHIGSRSADERGGGEGMRGNRDWHLRGSPQGMSFSSYRNVDDDFYMKEQMYKSDKLPRPPYQRHDAKPKRRDGGDYHGRLRHSEFEMTEETPRRTPEEKRQTSPGRGRSEKASRRHTIEKVLESGDDDDEECWYPKNMEELVTVDEVGGEDDSIIEPDLPELEEYASCSKESAGEERAEEQTQPPTLSLEMHETVTKTSNQEESREDAGDQTETSTTEKAANNLTATSTVEQKLNPVYLLELNFHFCVCCLIGVEFIVPQTGFYCKLCGLFYTSEETAKTSHCRSTVHYRNLQVHTTPSYTRMNVTNWNKIII